MAGRPTDAGSGSFHGQNGSSRILPVAFCMATQLMLAIHAVFRLA